jgi:Transposase DDE domain
MSQKTPFFSAFGPLLFGRRAHRKTPEVEDFGELQNMFKKQLPAGALKRARKGANSRERLFSLASTFWIFLFQVLSPSGACREAVRKAQAWWFGAKKDASDTDTSAYCQARKRLPLEVLTKLFYGIADKLTKRVLTHELWLGERPVRVLDGTGISMPDTAKNQARWPQPSQQKAGCGFPVIKMAALFCLHSGAMLRYTLGNKHNHEQTLTRDLIGALEEGDILLADRGFCSYAFICVLRALGVDSVMRLHQSRPRDFRRGKRLGEDDRLVTWQQPGSRKNDPWAADHANLPASAQIRIVHYRVEIPGFRVQDIYLATTLLDPEEYPREVLAELYLERWGIEQRFRDIKISMGADVLRCKSPEMIEKEICMNAIAHNLTRCIMQESAQRHDVELSQLSYKGTLDTMRHFADRIHAAQGRAREKLYDEMLTIIAKDLNPYRPNRTEPRVRKRRPKNFPLMTKPRHQYRPRNPSKNPDFTDL